MHESEIVEGSFLHHLQKKLQPQYVGWIDQYRAVLYALDINPDDPYVHPTY